MNLPVLNRKLVLEAPVRVPDGAGGFVESWEALGTLWGEVAPGTAREAAGEGAALAKVRCRISVRAAPAGSAERPVAGQRFRLGARLFRVLAVGDLGLEGRYLACLCEEEVAR